MSKILFVFFFALVLFEQTFAYDDASSFDDSLNKTQQLLKDQSQRNKTVSETTDAQKADSQVKNLAPDQKTQDEYYGLAADILNNYRDAKDEEGMKKSIQDGLRDPASFFKNLTPEQQAKIKELSGKVNPGSGPNP